MIVAQELGGVMVKGFSAGFAEELGGVEGWSAEFGAAVGRIDNSVWGRPVVSFDADLAADGSSLVDASFRAFKVDADDALVDAGYQVEDPLGNRLDDAPSWKDIPAVISRYLQDEGLYRQIVSFTAQFYRRPGGVGRLVSY